MSVQKIADWSAKRSGASITVRGVDRATGEPVIIKVSEILKHPLGVFAYLIDGSTRVELV